MNHLRLLLHLIGIRSHPEEETLMQLDFYVGLRALTWSNGCYVYCIPKERSLLH